MDAVRETKRGSGALKSWLSAFLDALVTERSSSKAAESSVPDLISVAPEIDGSQIAHDLCVRYTQKCEHCLKAVQLSVPLFMSLELIGMECQETQHRVFLVTKF